MGALALSISGTCGTHMQISDNLDDQQVCSMSLPAKELAKCHYRSRSTKKKSVG
jgi:hypothetical protein